MSEKIIKFPKKTKVNKLKKNINDFLKKLPINQEKNKEVKKMLFLVIIIGALSGYFIWNYFVENAYNSDVQIPESNNISFSNELPKSYLVQQLSDDFEQYEGSPILFYIYATWCKNCAKFTPTINEIAREFQNTNLKVVTLAIDKNIESEALKNYLSRFGEIYFEPKYLVSKDGFVDFLSKKGIKYNKYVPFTVLMSSEGEIITKFSGSKSENYLRAKVIKELNL